MFLIIRGKETLGIIQHNNLKNFFSYNTWEPPSVNKSLTCPFDDLYYMFLQDIKKYIQTLKNFVLALTSCGGFLINCSKSSLPIKVHRIVIIKMTR